MKITLLFLAGAVVGGVVTLYAFAIYLSKAFRR